MQMEELSNHSINDLLCSSENRMQTIARRAPAKDQRRVQNHSSQSTGKTAKRTTIRGQRRIYDYAVDPKTGWRFYKGSRRNVQTASSSSSKWDQTRWKTSNWKSQHSSSPDGWWTFFSELGQVSVAWRKSSSQPRGCVNSTRTNTARTELHSMVTFHHANTRGSRAGRLRIAHLCVLETTVIHVSFLAAPDTDHKHKFSLTHFIHLSYLSDDLSFTNKPYDSRPIYTCDVPRQSGGSTQIPSFTPKGGETKQHHPTEERRNAALP